MEVDVFDSEHVIRLSDGVTAVAGVAGPATDATPLVLLHGLSQQRHFWGPVIRRLHHRPVIAIDQRGHGASDATPAADFAIDRCAMDVLEIMNALGVGRVHLAGHSWGAAVALRVAAAHVESVASLGLIDGGLWVRPDEFDPATAREHLRPPELGMVEGEFWATLASGELSDTWSDETRLALTPTFVVDDHGALRTRIGIDRHMAVLDGLLAYDPWPDARAIACPAWHAKCLPRTGVADPLTLASIARTCEETAIRTHQWPGALHDVPLQWPALVAGFLDALVESTELEGAR